MLYNNPADGPVADSQGSHSWLGKWEGIFQSGNFQQIGKVRENHTKYWRSPGILDKHYSSFLVIFKLTYYYYLLQTKLWKGNVFTPVCQSFCSQWGVYTGKVITMIQDSGSFNALNSLCEELFPPMAVQYQLAFHLWFEESSSPFKIGSALVTVHYLLVRYIAIVFSLVVFTKFT